MIQWDKLFIKSISLCLKWQGDNSFFFVWMFFGDILVNINGSSPKLMKIHVFKFIYKIYHFSIVPPFFNVQIVHWLIHTSFTVLLHERARRVRRPFQWLILTTMEKIVFNAFCTNWAYLHVQRGFNLCLHLMMRHVLP